ncbi:ribosomal-protein-alanine N-acetyltransferase [Propionibacterium cyclohexanicum]|uniref:Ribosomal-protein-alanine N-acetyltransferase n=1 Tax=Propionibacterium cyclohexanicum TaxID=64702 RepID=A0A1H9S7I4_9ACTN|nr:ribosomal protein S18-alanine N-acetyltransferase [Propionibacterium cyclohexanicum]SER80911.1 ribosomal-protein-alanine N-acetyltransferase [Propionibacterium cyclohexanicum]
MKTAQLVSVLSAADLSSLLALEAAGFGQRERWSARSWQAELLAASRHGFAVRRGRDVVAACLVSVMLGEAELLRIVVAPQQRGQGLGRRLLGEAIVCARECGAERMLLEVSEHNDVARALYASAGFVPIHRRENYYGPDKDALVMAKTMTSAATRGKND